MLMAMMVKNAPGLPPESPGRPSTRAELEEVILIRISVFLSILYFLKKRFIIRQSKIHFVLNHIISYYVHISNTEIASKSKN